MYPHFLELRKNKTLLTSPYSQRRIQASSMQLLRLSGFKAQKQDEMGSVWIWVKIKSSKRNHASRKTSNSIQVSFNALEGNEYLIQCFLWNHNQNVLWGTRDTETLEKENLLNPRKERLTNLLGDTTSSPFIHQNLRKRNVSQVVS